jgi:cysteine sulfinate desulfinase/cysteine desulfurase-like protein
MRPETVLVSVMAVNNEIGVVQPLKQIGELCRSKKIFFHTDAAQVHTLATKHATKYDYRIRSLFGLARAFGPEVHMRHTARRIRPQARQCTGEGVDRTATMLRARRGRVMDGSEWSCIVAAGGVWNHRRVISLQA